MKDTDEHLLPSFLIEAFDDNSEGMNAERATDVLERFVPPLDDASRISLKQVLLTHVAQAPDCYAPFFDRLSDLFKLDEAAVSKLMADIGFKKTALPGISYRGVKTALDRDGVRAGLVRFAAGVHYPRHRHQALEQVLVLSGGYTDDRGHHYEAGDVHDMAAGTDHEFWVDTTQPCILATVSDTNVVWDSRILRLFSLVFGRFARLPEPE